MENNNEKSDALQDDPEYYFNEEHFASLVLNSDDFREKNLTEIRNLVGLLNTKDHKSKSEALQILKKQDGREMLLFAISSDEFREFRQALVASCWESGLDFSSYLEFFVQLILGSDFGISMEACTVIECMEGELKEPARSVCLTKLREYSDIHQEKRELILPILEFLSNRI